MGFRVIKHQNKKGWMAVAFVAVFALIAQPFVSLNLSAAFAADTLIVNPTQHTGVNNSGVADITNISVSGDAIAVNAGGPAVSNVQPAPGSAVSGKLPARTLKATVTDDEGVKDVRGDLYDAAGERKMTNAPMTPVAGQPNTYAYPRKLDTTPHADGNYQLVITATDNDGKVFVYNEARNSHLIVIDNEPDVKPTITSVAPVLYDGGNYKGLNTDFRFENVTGLTGAKVTVNRAGGSTVLKTMKQARMDYVNDRNGVATSLTIPFVIQAITYDESDSGSWSMPSTQEWTKDTAPESVTVEFMFDDSSRNTSLTAPVNNNGIDYKSLLPADTAGPSISQKTPTEDAVIGGKSYKVSAVVTDPSGVNESTVYAKFRDETGDEYTHYLTREAGSNVFSKVIDTTTIGNGNNGPNRVSFRAEDTLGNGRSSVSDGVIIDNRGPVISDKTPAENAVIRGDDYKVSATVKDQAGIKEDSVYVRFRDDAGKEYTYPMAREGSTNTYSVEVDTTKIGDGNTGPNRVSFRAVDTLGNPRSSVSDGVIIDNQGPTLSNVKPTSGSFKKSDFTVSIDATDDRSVKKIALYVINTETGKKAKEYAMQAPASGDTWAANVKLDDLDGDATYDLRFRAVDSINNVTYLNNRGGDYLVNVDTTMPDDFSLTLANGRDVQGATVRGEQTFVFTQNENNPQRIYIEYMEKDSNGDWQKKQGKEVLDNKRAELTVDTTKDSDGEYQIKVSTRDKAGNNTSTTAQFTVDNTNPTISIDIQEGDVNPTSYTLKASDKNGIESVTAILRKTRAANGPEVATECPKTMTSNFDRECTLPSDLEDGEYNIRYNARDKAGNLVPSKQVNFVIDNTRPRVTVVTPGDNKDLVNGQLDITGTATDNNGTGVEKILITIGKRNAADVFAGYVVQDVEATFVNGSFSYETQLPEYDGTYYVRAAAYDAAGNSRSAGANGLKVVAATVFPEGGTSTLSPSPSRSSSDTQGASIVRSVSNPVATSAYAGDSTFAPYFSSEGQVAVRDSADDDGDREDVLAVTDGEDMQTTSGAEATNNDLIDDNEQVGFLAGVAWYWWVVVAVAVASMLWWLLAALRRRVDED